MKILVCVRRLDRGGAEMLECRLARELQKMNLETHLACQYTEAIFHGSDKRQQWMDHGIKEVYFLNAVGVFNAIKALFRIIYLQIKNRYDIIITSNSGLDIYVGLVKPFLSFKHVMSFHTYINDEILQRFRIKLWKKLAKRADGYYCISDYVRNNIIAKLNLEPSKVKTIYNSIESEIELPPTCIRTELGLKEDSKIILLVGRIESRKGFDLAVEYLSNILRSPNVYMIVVGDAYQGNALEEGLIGFYRELHERIQSRRLEDKVKFTGFREDIRAIMTQATVFVHLARHEGFGLVLLEAIASGLPVVASNVGGIPEVLKGTCYKAFSLESKDEIEREVRYWLDLEEERRILMTQEAKSALEPYTDTRRAKDVFGLLNEIIEAE